jgi:hypothetical protein
MELNPMIINIILSILIFLSATIIIILLGWISYNLKHLKASADQINKNTAVVAKYFIAKIQSEKLSIKLKEKNR